VTQINSDWFAWFANAGSKRRIDVLQLLNIGHITYRLIKKALSCLHEMRLPKESVRHLQSVVNKQIDTVTDKEIHLDASGSKRERQRRIATEGMLLGGLIEKVFHLIWWLSAKARDSSRSCSTPYAASIPSA
jgi:hypothetical protein